MKPWARVAASLTGRLSRLAANAIMAVRGVIIPFEPNAPPTKGETTRTFSGSIPSRSRNAVFQPINELARLIDSEQIPGPGTGGREQFDRIVVLYWCFIFYIDLDIGTVDGSRGVACLRQVLMLLRLFGRITFR